MPKNLSILQLEEYHFIKYLHTKYNNYKLFYLRLVFDFLGVVLSFFKNAFVVYLSIYFLLYLLFSIFYINKIKIKRYIATKRIIRFVIVLFTLYILSTTIHLLPQTLYNHAINTVFMTLNHHILYFISFVINCIFECFLIKYYIKKSKVKLLDGGVKIIAITGSYGKTSVKNFLYQLLGERYNVIMTPKSYNTPSGISKTINESNLNGVDYIILEMGAKRKGDIAKLCKMFPPQYGVLVSIGEQHLETFKNIENIITTKRELQNNISSDGFMVFNCYNELVKESAGVYCGNAVALGENQKYSISDFVQNENGIEFSFNENSEKLINVAVCLYGFHNAINVALAISTALSLGVSIDKIEQGLSKITPVDSRLKPIKLNDNIVFNNGYNSNPISANCSLEVIANFKEYKKVVITPGFVEMGREQYRLNFEFGETLSKCADHIIVVKKINQKAIVDGIISSGYKGRLECVNNFSDIDFNNFTHFVVLIENDLPSNYI